MSNKKLLYYLKQHKAETDYPEKHTRYVTTKAFWGAAGVSLMKKELASRKKKGTIKKTAGKPTRKKQELSFW